MRLMYVYLFKSSLIRSMVLPTICDFLQYIAYAILLTCKNVCDIDIAYDDNIEI